MRNFYSPGLTGIDICFVMTDRISLIPPYKGKLIDLLVPAEERADLFAFASGLHSIQLTRRETCDLELLATGAFSPLEGFMNRADYSSVVHKMRLADGTVFPIPITLSVADLAGTEAGRPIALRDIKNDLLAVLDVEQIYEWDRETEPRGFGITMFDIAGVGDAWLGEIQFIRETQNFEIAGLLRLQRFAAYAAESRLRLEAMGRGDVVAFQTRNPMHYAHERLTQRAVEITGGTLFCTRSSG